MCVYLNLDFENLKKTKKVKMVDYHQRHMQVRKGVNMVTIHIDEENGCVSIKRSRPKLLFFLTFCSLLSCCLLLIPSLPSLPSSTFSLLYSYEDISDSKAPLGSSVSNGTIYCDRSSIRSDICILKGDIRTNSSSFSIFLYHDQPKNPQLEKIKPYTRKWEPSTMATIDELTLISKPSNSSTINNNHNCHVTHNVPAVFFSTGGFTGNVYHEFNDGLIPLYITSQKYNKKVVFVILEYHDWWIMKYGDVLSRLSDYEAIDFNGDNRTHCFREAVVGLRIHDELAINSTLTENAKTIVDFHGVLDKAYMPRIRDLIQEENVKTVESESESESERPKVVIISRNGSRAILNEDLLAKVAEKVGFSVEILRPEKTTELAKIYRSLNASDVMIGVHGAAMTHFLFMRPGSVFIQVVPLGTTWAAETYYGGPAKKLGLRYVGYEILQRESSLYDEYESNDVVLTDPDSVNDRGWEFTKKIYLDRQKVKLNLARFRKHLVQSHLYIMAKRNQVRV